MKTISLEASLAAMPKHLCYHHPDKKAEWVVEGEGGGVKVTLFVCWDCLKDKYRYDGKPLEAEPSTTAL